MKLVIQPREQHQQQNEERRLINGKKASDTTTSSASPNKKGCFVSIFKLMVVVVLINLVHEVVNVDQLVAINKNKNTESSTTTTAAAVQEHCRAILDALDDTFDERRRMRQKREASTPENKIPSPRTKTFFDPYEPEAVCITDERFGGPQRHDAIGDGPKFMCGIDLIASTPNEPCLVYSVGSNNDISFEVAVKSTMPHCEIHTFDPTLTRPFVGDKYATFHPWGFGADGSTVQPRDKEPFETKSFETIYNLLGHQGRKIDIFKIDCEGCEFTVLPAMFEAIANGTLKVDQMQVEIHAIDHLKPLFSGADAADMRIFHKERNSWGCGGTFCVEYAFVSASFLRTANAFTMCDATLVSNNEGSELQNAANISSTRNRALQALIGNQAYRRSK